MPCQSLLYDLFALLFVFQVKHFLADFPLQTPWMLGKFKSGWGWVLPLAAHSFVHAVGTLLIAVSFALYRWDENSSTWVLYVAAFDFLLHFCMDRIKASPNLLGRYQVLSKNDFVDLLAYEQDHGEDEYAKKLKKNNRLFWFSLAIDQGFHHLTHYAIIYYILMRLYS